MKDQNWQNAKPKKIRLDFTVSSEDYNTIKEKSQAAGLTMTNFLRRDGEWLTRVMAGTSPMPKTPRAAESAQLGIQGSEPPSKAEDPKATQEAMPAIQGSPQEVPDPDNTPESDVSWSSPIAPVPEAPRSAEAAQLGKVMAAATPVTKEAMPAIQDNPQEVPDPDNTPDPDNEALVSRLSKVMGSAMPAPQEALQGIQDNPRVAIHSRLHPPTDSTSADRNQVDCPLPEGRGYQEGIPGFAGSQAGISLTAGISLEEEVSDHKGNSDEQFGDLLKWGFLTKKSYRKWKQTRFRHCPRSQPILSNLVGFSSPGFQIEKDSKWRQKLNSFLI